MIIMESLFILRCSQRFPRSASCTVARFLFSPRPPWSVVTASLSGPLTCDKFDPSPFVFFVLCRHTSLFLLCSFLPTSLLLQCQAPLCEPSSLFSPKERHEAVDEGLLENSGKFFIYFLHHVDRHLKMKLFLSRLSSGAAEVRLS